MASYPSSPVPGLPVLLGPSSLALKSRSCSLKPWNRLLDLRLILPSVLPSLWNSYNMPGIVLGTGDPAADTEHTETDNNPDLTLLGGGERALEP